MASTPPGPPPLPPPSGQPVFRGSDGTPRANDINEAETSLPSLAALSPPPEAKAAVLTCKKCGAVFDDAELVSNRCRDCGEYRETFISKGKRHKHQHADPINTLRMTRRSSNAIQPYSLPEEISAPPSPQHSPQVRQLALQNFAPPSPLAAAAPVSQILSLDAAPIQEIPREAPDQMHERLVLLTEGDPLELAALARLSVWEQGDQDYRLDEMMELARWMEAELDPPAVFDVFVHGLGGKARARCRATGISCSFCLVMLVFIMLVAWAGIEVVKPARVSPLGFFHDGDDKVASAASAVEYRSFRDFANIPIQDLRRIEDVTLTRQGDFHLYRVASVSRLPGGRVQIVAEDGSVLLVDRSASVSLTRMYEGEELLTPSEVDSLTATLRSLTPYIVKA